jgi:hypothetical protein
MENEKFYNIVKGFVSILNIYRNISLPGNGRKMRIWDSRRELGQKILKIFFFRYFAMSVHQSTQNLKANRLMYKV